MAFHQDVRGPVAPAVFEPVGQASIRCRFKSIDGQCWTGHVTAESFQAATVMRRYRNVGV
jgi:hypothetical protein